MTGVVLRVVASGRPGGTETDSHTGSHEVTAYMMIEFNLYDGFLNRLLITDSKNRRN